jgi:hypothetical protein
MTRDFPAGNYRFIPAVFQYSSGAAAIRALRSSACASGGLPGPVNYAYAGTHRWDRADGEEFDAFVQRSAYTPPSRSARWPIDVGGLPRSDEIARFATFEDCGRQSRRFTLRSRTKNRPALCGKDRDGEGEPGRASSVQRALVEW